MRFIPLLLLLLTACGPALRPVYFASREPKPADEALLRRAASSSDRWKRLFGLRGLGKLKLAPPEKPKRDPDAQVRYEALKAAKAAGQDVREAAKDESAHVRTLVPSLSDRSVLVRAAAAPLDKASAGLRDPHWYVRVAAGGHLKDSDPRVRAAALETASTDTVRAVLKDKTSSLPELGTALERLKEPTDHPLARTNPELRKLLGLPADPSYYWDKTAPSAKGLVLETERGEIVLVFYPDKAPRHVAAIAAVAAKGGYDGTIFHRVVPNFVVQGGDPTGSGWGDCGFALKDELNDVKFERGVLGMPNAGPDTGGCQLFITTVPALHLDGKYTAFGRVVRGMEAVDALEPGDRIVRARVLK